MRRHLLAAGLVALLVACSRDNPSTAPGPVAGDTDTFIGVVRLTSADRSAPVDLLPSSPNGETYGSPVKLIGAPMLASVNGLRVRLIGTQAHHKQWPDLVRVLTFTVIWAKGQGAIDGVLTHDGGGFAIVTADGERHALASAPPDLRAHVGARVWIAGPLDREPVAYGVIE